MDFSGASPREAGERLFEFVRQFADENGMDFAYEAQAGSFARKCEVYVHSVSGASFYLQMSIRGDWLLPTVLGVFGSRYGGGRVTSGKAAALLELRRDDEGMYRWHRLPAEVSTTGRKLRACGNALWFPLMSDYVIELLAGTRDAAPEVGTNEPRM